MMSMRRPEKLSGVIEMSLFVFQRHREVLKHVDRQVGECRFLVEPCKHSGSVIKYSIS